MLIRVKGFFSASLVFGLLFSVPILSSAHHSVFPYDMVTFLELEGLITEVRWRSPHIRLKIAAESDSGETVEWELEGDSINAAMRRGLTRESISVGDRVRIAAVSYTHLTLPTILLV